MIQTQNLLQIGTTLATLHLLSLFLENHLSNGQTKRKFYLLIEVSSQIFGILNIVFMIYLFQIKPIFSVLHIPPLVSTIFFGLDKLFMMITTVGGKRQKVYSKESALRLIGYILLPVSIILPLANLFGVIQYPGHIFSFSFLLIVIFASIKIRKVRIM